MAKAQAAAKHEPEARRDQVLRVAEALFARAGYRGVGLREIAAQVGIRAPSLFKHFPQQARALQRGAAQHLRPPRRGGRAARGRRAVRGAAGGFRRRLRRPGGQRSARRAAALPRADGALRGDGSGDARRRPPRSTGASTRFSRPASAPASSARSIASASRSRSPARSSTTAWRAPVRRDAQRVAPPDRAAWKRTVLDLARGALLAPPPLRAAGRGRAAEIPACRRRPPS